MYVGTCTCNVPECPNPTQNPTNSPTNNIPNSLNPTSVPTNGIFESPTLRPTMAQTGPPLGTNILPKPTPTKPPPIPVFSLIHSSLSFPQLSIIPSIIPSTSPTVWPKPTHKPKPPAKPTISV